jgi:curved DNA-binding protein CbpA
LAAGASVEAIQAAYKAKALSAHPDRGGAHDAMAQLNEARKNALRERGG